MTVEMLQGKLLTHEMAMKNDESDDDSRKKKSVAFKSSFKDESDSDEKDDEEFIVLTRKFKSFLRKDKLKNQGQQKKNYKSSKGKGECSKKDEIICYKCKKAEHIKSECPNNDEKSLKAKKKKKAMVATWSCSEDSSCSKEVSDMEAHICLRANDDTDEFCERQIHFRVSALPDPLQPAKSPSCCHPFPAQKPVGSLGISPYFLVLGLKVNPEISPLFRKSGSALFCSVRLLLLPVVGANSFEFSPRELPLQIAAGSLTSQAQFLQLEILEAKPRTGKPREVTS
ncbi:hypothetical protein SLEP1_g54670 [Rubroshorea leprosula]|uniref:CCHC-type domain-containing protein n=1 Tax=Rubroshorea leprosula TaxID=152421 RepID=A0AAV5MG28_9ROSI|nr:hypothetical protein SLEP1_g54670 [Rubroshorea leprosula]